VHQVLNASHATAQTLATAMQQASERIANGTSYEDAMMLVSFIEATSSALRRVSDLF
jgi:hypothetical protein